MQFPLARKPGSWTVLSVLTKTPTSSVLWPHAGISQQRKPLASALGSHVSSSPSTRWVFVPKFMLFCIVLWGLFSIPPGNGGITAVGAWRPRQALVGRVRGHCCQTFSEHAWQQRLRSCGWWAIPHCRSFRYSKTGTPVTKRGKGVDDGKREGAEQKNKRKASSAPPEADHWGWLSALWTTQIFRYPFHYGLGGKDQPHYGFICIKPKHKQGKEDYDCLIKSPTLLKVSKGKYWNKSENQ